MQNNKSEFRDIYFKTDLIPINPASNYFYFCNSPKIIEFRKVKDLRICNQFNFMSQCIRNEQQLFKSLEISLQCEAFVGI